MPLSRMMLNTLLKENLKLPYVAKLEAELKWFYNQLKLSTCLRMKKKNLKVRERRGKARLRV
jgi:hypothetical protein